MRKTYPIVTRNSNAYQVTLVNAIYMQLLEDSMRIDRDDQCGQLEKSSELVHREGGNGVSRCSEKCLEILLPAAAACFIARLPRAPQSLTKVKL